MPPRPWTDPLVNVSVMTPRSVCAGRTGVFGIEGRKRLHLVRGLNYHASEMLVNVCEACGRRTVSLSQSDAASCSACGEPAVTWSPVTISIPMNGADLTNLEGESASPREDLYELL